MALPKTFVIPRPTLVAIEQWFCFLLGIVCMASGVWGICMSHSEDLLGSAVVPALRVTAAACLGMGVELVRRGFAKTLQKSELPDLESTNKPADLKRLREPAKAVMSRSTVSPNTSISIEPTQTERYR
jgi:hypothetical protein